MQTFFLRVQVAGNVPGHGYASANASRPEVLMRSNFRRTFSANFFAGGACPGIRFHLHKECRTAEIWISTTQTFGFVLNHLIEKWRDDLQKIGDFQRKKLSLVWFFIEKWGAIWRKLTIFKPCNWIWFDLLIEKWIIFRFFRAARAFWGNHC